MQIYTDAPLIIDQYDSVRPLKSSSYGNFDARRVLQCRQGLETSTWHVVCRASDKIWSIPCVEEKMHTLASLKTFSCIPAFCKVDHITIFLSGKPCRASRFDTGWQHRCPLSTSTSFPSGWVLSFSPVPVPAFVRADNTLPPLAINAVAPAAMPNSENFYGWWRSFHKAWASCFQVVKLPVYIFGTRIWSGNFDTLNQIFYALKVEINFDKNWYMSILL